MLSVRQFMNSFMLVEHIFIDEFEIHEFKSYKFQKNSYEYKFDLTLYLISLIPIKV